MKQAMFSPIRANKATRLLSLHGRANNDGFPRDSRTLRGYRRAIFLSADFDSHRGPALPQECPAPANPCFGRRSLCRREDAKRAFEQAEFDRTIANQFAVELDRDRLVAFN